MTGPNDSTRPFAPAAEPTTPELDGYDPKADPVGDVLTRVEDGLAVERAAAALIQASRLRPDEVVPTVAGNLSAADRNVRRASGRTLAQLGSDRPEALADAAAELAAAVEADDQSVRDYALLALVSLAREAPLAARPAVDPSGRLLTSNVAHVRGRATRIHTAVAVEAPSEVARWIPELIDVATETNAVPETDYDTMSLDDTASTLAEAVPREVRERMQNSRRATERSQARQAMTSEIAAEAVALVTDADPGLLTDHLSPVYDAIASGAALGVRTDLLTALTTTAEARPGEVVASADRVAKILASEADPEILRQVASVLAFCADVDAAAVANASVDHLSSLRRLAMADDPGDRTAAVSLLSYVAEQRPEPVADAVGPTLCDCAQDAHKPVRAGAVWCLRFLTSEHDDAEETLRSVARSDDDQEIRHLASNAVESDAA